MTGRRRGGPAAAAGLAGLCLLLAPPAQAGDFSAPPVNSNACGEANVDGSAMADPATAFVLAATPELCADLCDQAGKLCRTYVKDTFDCRRRVLANTRAFANVNCESLYETSADVSACKGLVKAYVEPLAASVRHDQTAELGDCVTWRGTCRAACTP